MTEPMASAEIARDRTSGWAARIADFDRPLLLQALLLTVIVLAYFWTPTDPDVWWHLRDGQTILQTGHVPTTALYTHTVPGARWIPHEWLIEVVMYAAQWLAGYWLVVLLFGLASAGAYLLLFGALRGAGASRALALVGVTGAVVLDAPIWGVRPQVWSTLLVIAFLAVLLRYRRLGRADGRLWLLPGLMLVWANLHAGYTAGLLLLGAFVAGEVINTILGWPAAPVRPLLLVGLGCALASLINPNGLDLWYYPITYLNVPGGSVILRFIQEWQPPDFRDPRSLPFAATLLILLALNLMRRAPADAATSPGRPGAAGTGDASLILALAGFTVMALRAVRFLPLYGALWAVTLVHRASDLWPRLEASSGAPAALPESAARRAILGRVNLGFYVLVAGLLAAVILTNPRAQTHAAPLDGDYPVGAVAYLTAPARTLSQPLRLFNEYGWGGFLIAKGLPTFVDGRTDLYEGVLDDYVAASGGVRWEPIFARYGVNAALIRPGSGLDRALQAAPGWSAAYHDALSVLYLRK
jgi:hypothetical protein